MPAAPRSRRPAPARGPSLLALALALLGAAALRAAPATQTCNLQPGWNSIFLEVAPANPDPAVVFAGLPVDQVWTYFPTRTPVEYLANPSEGLFNLPGWNVWLPPTRPDAALLTNLQGVLGHQAYLVRNTATTAATLTVTGDSTLRGVTWNPDSYTLTGLPVDPSTTVRSGDFFAGSPAHAGQPRYALAPGGNWVALADGTALGRGQAYWVFTRGGSDFSAPLEVTAGGSAALDYGQTLDTLTLILRNRSLYPSNYTLANTRGLPLSYQAVDPAKGNVWNLLPASLLTPASTTLSPGASVTLTLGVRRAGLTAGVNALLRVSGGGVAWDVPVTAGLPTGSGGAVPGNANTGLWVGTATLNAVTEANTKPNAAPTAAPTFSLRLLVHVDDGNAARLLKEVTLMKQRVPGGTSTDPAHPPAFVLITDPVLLGSYDAPQTRDGSPFATRISTAGFDFAGNNLPLSGSFGTALNGTVTVDRALPTNPFRHRYHPDHDGLTPQGTDQAALTPRVPADQQEVWGVSRAVTLTFDAPNPNNPDPTKGYLERTGTYQEVLGGVGGDPGLHKNAITVSGTFVLRRLNSIGQLDPAP